MNKLVIFNSDFQIINVISNIDDYEYGLTSVKGQNGYLLQGSTTPFVIVEESAVISEITKVDVIKFLLHSEINRLSKESYKNIDSEFYSNVKDAIYSFSTSDQAHFTQQLVLLLADASTENVVWRTVDKGFLLHTREEFIAICKEGETHTRNWITNTWMVESHLIETVTEYEQLFTIDSLEEEIVKLAQIVVEEPIIEPEPVEEPIEEEPVVEPEPVVEEPIIDVPIEEPVEEPVEEPIEEPTEPIVE